MDLFSLKRFFSQELSTLYTSSERDQLFFIFLQEKENKSRIQFWEDSSSLIKKNKQKEWKSILYQLKQGKPYQQILGKVLFFELEFQINEHVLIPRPETEELLDLAIKKITKSSLFQRKTKVLEIGTGSGVIPIILKKNFPNFEIFSIDRCKKAITVAKRNAEIHKTPVHFLHTDYLQYKTTEKFDIIISNPPYIGKDEEKEIRDSVKMFEPQIALFPPNEDHLIFYRKIAKDAPYILNKKGMLFLEINQKLGKETSDLFLDDFIQSELLKDMSGNFRFIIGEKR